MGKVIPMAYIQAKKFGVFGANCYCEVMGGRGEWNFFSPPMSLPSNILRAILTQHDDHRCKAGDDDGHQLKDSDKLEKMKHAIPLT